ncbi:hypothetical protein [Streptomyces sp. 351MFTsu5.1]|uniref:hypothetical protein n=1 Tax=Streptomyces sp. 351MFTsu5.1 TaxID=1172180 RepID=UPI00131A366B|nr:hypothetical protein [Streptomyces sp. 351MFTsu5.1]
MSFPSPMAAAAVIRKFSFYSAVQVVSVVAPGLCTITAGLVALIHVQHPHNLWSFVVAETGSVSTPLAIVLGLNLLAISFIAGYVFRGLAFWLIGLIEKIPDSETFIAQLNQTCGEQAIDDCLQAHPQLAHYLRASDASGPNAGPNYGGGHRNHHRLMALNYCKDRLREKSPVLAVDNNEAEINILTSCLFPVLLVSADIIWIGDFPLAVNVLVSIGCAGTWVGLVRSTLRLRTTESISAVINLSYTASAQQPPPPPMPVTN